MNLKLIIFYRHVASFKILELLNIHPCVYTNSFLASSDFCRPLITFANRLDPDQARQNVGPDMDPNHMKL